MATNWKATQVVKHNRMIRDTQFELTMLAKNDLNKEYQRQKHEKEANDGIDSFEYQLKRSGLGNTDDSAKLSVSYEDGEAFIKRLQDLTIRKLPSNEETNMFLKSLKDRTNQARMVRLEKARRKRRMLVDQSDNV